MTEALFGGPARRPPEPRIGVVISLLSQGSAQRTGAWTYAKEIIAELGRRPDSVAVEVLANEHGHRLLDGQLPAAVKLSRARGYSVGRTRPRRWAAMAAAVAAPGRYERQITPGADLVHYPLTLNVPRLTLPTVMTLHDIQHHDLPAGFSAAERAWRSVIYDRAARRAQFVVTDSDHARLRIIEVIGVDPDRIETVHLGVDPERFNEGGEGAAERAPLPADLPERFLFYPASLWPHKNHLALFDALALAEDRELCLVLTGATFGRGQWLMEEADRRGLARRVRHLEFVDLAVVPSLYRAATALVFPSTYEGFGAPPLEAMACGCPVASSLAGSLREVCGSAVAPLEPSNPEQMAATIDQITADETLRSMLREAGREQAAKFTWRRSVDQLLAAYRRALEPT